MEFVSSDMILSGICKILIQIKELLYRIYNTFFTINLNPMYKRTRFCNKIFIIVNILLIMMVISCSAFFRSSGENEKKKIEFETIAKGGQGRIEETVNMVIKDLEKLDSLWNVVFKTRIPKPELPEINFEKEMVLAVFMGYLPTGGYSVSIENIYSKGCSLIVERKVVTPGPDDLVTDEETQPFHIVKTAKTDKEIIFVKSE